MKKVIIVAAMLFAYGAKAQQKNNSQKIQSHIILEKLLNDSGISNKQVQMEIVDFPPLSSSPAHRHPCPTFGFVLEGKIESVFEGKSYEYNTGDSFFENANGLHSKTRNPDKTKWAKLLVFYITNPNAETSVREK